MDLTRQKYYHNIFLEVEVEVEVEVKLRDEWVTGSNNLPINEWIEQFNERQAFR